MASTGLAATTKFQTGVRILELRDTIEYVRIPVYAPRCPGKDGIVRQHIVTDPAGPAECTTAGGDW